MKTKIIYFVAAFLLTTGQAYSMLAHRYDFRSSIHDNNSAKACEQTKVNIKDAPVCNQANDVVDGKPLNVKLAPDCNCQQTSWQDNPAAQSCTISVEWDCETKN